MEKAAAIDSLEGRLSLRQILVEFLDVVIAEKIPMDDAVEFLKSLVRLLLFFFLLVVKLLIFENASRILFANWGHIYLTFAGAWQQSPLRIIFLPIFRS